MNRTVIALLGLTLPVVALAQKLPDPEKVAPEYRDAAEKRLAQGIRRMACIDKAEKEKGAKARSGDVCQSLYGFRREGPTGRSLNRRQSSKRDDELIAKTAFLQRSTPRAIVRRVPPEIAKPSRAVLPASHHARCSAT